MNGFTIEQKIEAFSLMASLIDSVGPADYEDTDEVTRYETAYKLAQSLMTEALIERDTRELVAASLEKDPTWKSDMTELRRLARQRVRSEYAA